MEAMLSVVATKERDWRSHILKQESMFTPSRQPDHVPLLRGIQVGTAWRMQTLVPSKSLEFLTRTGDERQEARRLAMRRFLLHSFVYFIHTEISDLLKLSLMQVPVSSQKQSRSREVAQKLFVLYPGAKCFIPYSVPQTCCQHT